MRKTDFARLRDWSGDLLRRYERGELRVGKYDDGPIGVRVPAREIPAWLTVPNVSIHKGESGRAECVMLDWDHYGLLVGPTNYAPTFQPWYITNLMSGIFAYHVEK